MCLTFLLCTQPLIQINYTIRLGKEASIGVCYWGSEQSMQIFCESEKKRYNISTHFGLALYPGPPLLIFTCGGLKFKRRRPGDEGLTLLQCIPSESARSVH